MKYLLILIIPFILSCSAQKRAQRHLRKAIALNPALIQPETIEIHDTIIINEFYGDTVYETKFDTALLDSLLERFKDRIKQTTLDSLKRALKPIYKSFIKDTLTGVWDDGNIITKTWQENGKIKQSLRKLKKKIPYNKTLIRPVLVPADCKTKPSDIGWIWIVVIMGLMISLVLCLLRK